MRVLWKMFQNVWGITYLPSAIEHREYRKNFYVIKKNLSYKLNQWYSKWDTGDCVFNLLWTIYGKMSKYITVGVLYFYSYHIVSMIYIRLTQTVPIIMLQFLPGNHENGIVRSLISILRLKMLSLLFVC